MPEPLEQEIRTLQALLWSERDPEGLAFATLADAYLRAGRKKQALDLLEDGTARHPSFASGHIVAMRLYQGQGMLGEAELAARRVLELDSQNVVALVSLEAILREQDRVVEAEDRKSTRLNSSHSQQSRMPSSA